MKTKDYNTNEPNLDLKILDRIVISNQFGSNLISDFENINFDDYFLRTSKFLKNLRFDTDIFSNLRTLQVSELEKLKSLNDFELSRLKDSIKYHSHSDPSGLLKRIKNLSTEELIDLYNSFEYNSENEDVKSFLQYYIHKKHQIEWILRFINQIENKLKFLKSKTLKLSRNKRLYHRKLQGFHFKNLDDYDEYSIIQNLQFKVVKQLAVLIFNNRNDEKKYFKTNRRSYSF